MLLWWLSALDGWAILDGHDRAVAALAEDMEPESVVLTRGEDDETRDVVRTATTVHYEKRLAALPPDAGSFREALARSHGGAMIAVEYSEAPTPAWPIPGGAAEWDALMLEFRHEHDRS
ncbi:hypothetical protein ACGFMM_01140 [Streptomyces sp. NPDC048604]|uniref:hypothetical protein n=1 Tax=Streptomyces sp. NPDC048604 TaxID=3365578 RepID=UPI00371649C1